MMMVTRNQDQDGDDHDFEDALYQVMEFSKPFKYQGITILQKRVITTSYQIA